MGLHAERNNKVEEYSRRSSRATIQLGGLHDALHVYFLLLCICYPCDWSFALLSYKFLSNSLNLCFRTIYNMCTQKPPHDYSQQLYDKYRESFEEYITSTVSELISFFLCIKFITYLYKLVGDGQK